MSSSYSVSCQTDANVAFSPSYLESFKVIFYSDLKLFIVLHALMSSLQLFPKFTTQAEKQIKKNKLFFSTLILSISFLKEINYSQITLSFSHFKQLLDTFS